MSVQTKRALWLGSAVSIAFGFVSVAAADEAAKSVGGVKVTEGIQVAQATTPAAEEEKPEEKKVERVVVTGSRLKKNEFTSSAPIQVITTEETTLEGLNDTADIVQGSPLSAGSQQINNTFGGFVTQGGPGANTVSLRGLGAQRTLILVNGRRISPAGTRGQLGSPDLNTIPESMIDRIEILKDGGSSIYGSDAVAGVVNFITKQNYDGISLSGSTNMAFEGGGETYQLNGTWGETFDRGQFMLAGEYYRRDPLRIGDRDYFDCAQDRVIETGLGASISGVGVGGNLDIIDPATGESKCFNLLAGVADRLISGGRFVPVPGLVAGGGFIPTLAPAVTGSLPDLAGYRRVNHTFAQVNAFITNLCLTPPHNAAAFCATPASRLAEAEARWRASTAATPNDDPRFLSTTLIAPAERYGLYFQGSYDLIPGAEAYTELAFSRRESEQERWRQLFPNVDGTNPNNQAATGGFGQLARSIIQVPTDASQTVDYYRAVLGIRGDFSESFPIFGGWSYDFYGQHIRSEADYTNDIIYNDRVLATTAAGSVCVQALITISGGSCAAVPGGIRWFNADVITKGWDGGFSQAERDFLFTKETGHTTYSQTLFNGVVTGDLFALPAGAVSAALGFEYRTDELDDTPGPQARQNNLWGQTSAGRTAGTDTVREVFGELSVPILAGKSFAESLTVDGSARYTSYDSYGEDSTYKLGMNWQITPEYRIRGTTGTSFRAPALFEIFLANQTGFLGQNQVDPCLNWNLSANPLIVQSCGPTGLNLPVGYNGPYPSALIVTGGGGPGVLSAETSEARTVGFIWTPDWIDFSVALDYFEFEVNNQVGQFGALNIVTACHTQPPFPTSAFCGLFNRDTNPASPTFGMITTVNNSFVNISNQVTDGLDVTIRYEHEFSFGRLLINGQGTWTFTDEIRVLPSAPVNDFNGEVYDSDFVANFDVRFDHEDWTFFWNVDMASRASNDEAFGSSVFLWRGTPFAAHFKQYTEFVATHDVSTRYRADDWSIIVGVQNVFDDEPPAVSQAGAFGKVGNSVAIGGPYDLLGRRGFIEITKEF
jgi:iron complex outermembrane receptor protein